jgi:hypothetical protein
VRVCVWVRNNIIFYIEILVRQEREPLLVAAARKASRHPTFPVTGQQFASRGKTPPRRQIAARGGASTASSAGKKPLLLPPSHRLGLFLSHGLPVVTATARRKARPKAADYLD